MYEKVNPAHPDKIADRIAGALVDLAYARQMDPRIAVEVLIGHGVCHIIAESSVQFDHADVAPIVGRIAGETMSLDLVCVPQDSHLSDNQADEIRCGDNGIFRGTPVTDEQTHLTELVKKIYAAYPHDGKYLADCGRYVACQSNVDAVTLRAVMPPHSRINPIGDWTGGPDVDSGATNRKLGSDMGDSVTGGGLHGKDLSKADVSVNIFCWLRSQETGRVVQTTCAIGDTTVDGVPYAEIVETARRYIHRIGGFEKFAEWGLIR